MKYAYYLTKNEYEGKELIQVSRDTYIRIIASRSKLSTEYVEKRTEELLKRLKDHIRENGIQPSDVERYYTEPDSAVKEDEYTLKIRYIYTLHDSKEVLHFVLEWDTGDC